MDEFPDNESISILTSNELHALFHGIFDVPQSSHALKSTLIEAI